MDNFSFFWITALATFGGTIIATILMAIFKKELLKTIFNKILGFMHSCLSLIFIKIPIWILIIAIFVTYKFPLWTALLPIIIWIIIYNYKQTLPQEEDNLSKEEVAFLILVRKRGGNDCYAETIQPNYMSLEKTKYYLEELYRKEYVNYSFDPTYGSAYVLTHKGRKYLLNVGLL